MNPMFADLNAERECSFDPFKSSPRTLASPREGFSSPAMMLRTVVLPAPDGPTIAATSPSLMLSVIDERALRGLPFTRYSLETSTKSTASPGALTSIPSSWEAIGVLQIYCIAGAYTYRQDRCGMNGKFGKYESNMRSSG